MVMMTAGHAASHAPAAEAVKAVSPADRKRAVATIAIAFASDPMMRWSFPDPDSYFEIARDLIDAFGGHAVHHGGADEIADFSAAALWLPPGVSPDGEAMDAIFKAHMPSERMQDGERIFEQMNKFHPHEPHWYLPLIGADPTKQGRGYGSALLKYGVARCDRDGLSAYLESSSPANLPLYERFGFEIIGTIQQGSSPELIPMLRKPH